jgi:hypothetical protein
MSPVLLVLIGFASAFVVTFIGLLVGVRLSERRARASARRDIAERRVIRTDRQPFAVGDVAVLASTGEPVRVVEVLEDGVRVESVDGETRETR